MDSPLKMKCKKCNGTGLSESQTSNCLRCYGSKEVISPLRVGILGIVGVIILSLVVSSVIYFADAIKLFIVNSFTQTVDFIRSAVPDEGFARIFIITLSLLLVFFICIFSLVFLLISSL